MYLHINAGSAAFQDGMFHKKMIQISDKMRIDISTAFAPYAYYKKDYVASPYAMLWSDNNYYLLAYESGEMKHFRVDKMDHIDIVYQKRQGKDVFSKIDISKRPLRMFGMFSGKEKTVKLRFANYLANVVLDRFGKDAVLAYEDEKHFTFTTVIETSPQFYGWLCGLGKGVRVVSPPEVVEEMGNYVKGIAEMY